MQSKHYKSWNITFNTFFLPYAMDALIFRLASRVAMTSWYFQPTSCDKRPTVQY